MSYAFEQVKEAYIKLRTYVYYDSADILLRRKLVEFETNKTKDGLFFDFGVNIPEPYQNIEDIFSADIAKSVDQKLEILTDALNNYHKDSAFFDYFLEQISVDFYPKTFDDDQTDDNFITNRRVEKNYSLNRASAFINAPIEIHLITVLWIMEFGPSFERELTDHCFGNRLLLNKSRDRVVQGSSLFRPYYSQYQKWRDDSVSVAQHLLSKQKNVLFLNLDIQDYFHSVRIDTSLISGKTRIRSVSNLQQIFLRIHIDYTELISNKHQIPHNFYKTLQKDENDELKEVILPIGLLSSYVLANYYLKDFDTRILQKVKPAYYGRYVDDILIVLSDPKTDYHDHEELPELRFLFEDYKKAVNQSKDSSEKVSYSKDEMSTLEKYVLENFFPILKLVDSPRQSKESKSKKVEKAFKLNGYKSLYCQSKKSLVYFFDFEESDLVIDKLKRELDEKTSEFRDFPEDSQNEDTFEESAYHLQYDGTEGKIRTLKDYKENRYGLTVYLANKIFSALRHEKRISDEERDQVLKFFRGSNCLNFYRLWERIFTFFLVNDHATAYVEFYLHCAEEVKKITGTVQSTKVQASQIANTLIDYLDCAHELALSLNPHFFVKAREAAKNFEFRVRQIQYEPFNYWFNFEPTHATSSWGKRFRDSNMIRHHYVIHPLLTYTKKSRKGAIDLTSLNLSIGDYSLDKYLVANSPRPVKFWECCLATAFIELSRYGTRSKTRRGGFVDTNILGVKDIYNDQEEIIGDSFYLDEAFELFQKINQNHYPSYVLNDPEFRNHFYSRHTDPLKYDKVKPVKVQEIKVNFLKNKLAEPRISFANTEVKEENIIKSLRGKPNLGVERYHNLVNILRKAREEKSNILLFPEFFIPINLLSSIVRHSSKNDFLTVLGLEHITIGNTCFNFIVTILPLEVNEIQDAVVVFRLKNHYAHIEEALIDGNHFTVPNPSPYRYDIFNWKNIYFSTFYCFELANALHRSLMKGKIDLLIGVEWNKDTPYFSNIVESGTRDLHTYVAQVNTSQFGDTRLTQPVESARKDILKLKGGINDAILVAKINISKLREFQRQKFSITHAKGDFKPLPPDFSVDDVLKRINNQSVL